MHKKYLITKKGVLRTPHIGLSLVLTLLIFSCTPMDYDFIGTWNRQPDKLTYINYDQHIKLTFPNDKWRVYTKPGERLRRIWKNPWKENSAYHVLWAFVEEMPILIKDNMTQPSLIIPRPSR